MPCMVTILLSYIKVCEISVCAKQKCHSLQKALNAFNFPNAVLDPLLVFHCSLRNDHKLNVLKHHKCLEVESPLDSLGFFLKYHKDESKVLTRLGSYL